jgi:hypothetical protein
VVEGVSSIELLGLEGLRVVEKEWDIHQADGEERYLYSFVD